MSSKMTSAYPMKNSLLARRFSNSASVLLLTFALALALCNVTNWGLVPPHDPLLGLSLRTVFWILGGLFLAVALACLGAGAPFLRIFLVAWVAFGFEVYQLVLLFAPSRAMHGYFGYFSSVFNLPSQLIALFAQGAFLYLLAGGIFLVFQLRRGEQQDEALARQKASGEMLKCKCHACGGPILFSATNLGQQLPCPHCQANITLRKPDEKLKISCFFCKEHIEFPAHAIGEKLKCPHCHKDITLKELASQTQIS